jgi:hypothetical protein
MIFSFLLCLTLHWSRDTRTYIDIAAGELFTVKSNDINPGGSVHQLPQDCGERLLQAADTTAGRLSSQGLVNHILLNCYGVFLSDTRFSTLKGQCHEIFDFWFFS